MRAAVLYGNYDLKYEEYPEPILRSGHIKIKVCVCGVCGSDIPRIVSNGAHYYPIILGHEVAGIVSEVADDVTDLKAGDHVTIAPLVPCLKCDDCLNGNYSQCKNYTFIGSRIQGGYAEYLVVPQRNVVKISDRIDFSKAAFIEPATVALHGIRLLEISPMKRVAIIGGGTVGLFAMQWARKFGAKNVTVFGRSHKHLEVAKRLGADCTVSTLDDCFLQQVDEITLGKGFDYVIETSGATETIKLSYVIAANHANICMIGTPSKTISFMPNEWELMNRKELFVTGSWMSGSMPYPGDEWRYTADCMAKEEICVDDEQIFAQIPLSAPEKLIEILKNPSNIKGRIQLVIE